DSKTRKRTRAFLHRQQRLRECHAQRLVKFFGHVRGFNPPLRLCVKCPSKIKAPGMADMPGESQEEPSVMVVTILATIR
ncbi:MAG TPA: hypothetical protein VFX63_05510, partial [Pyrinomonadaceae bacterium]|nr:hypothetical protein [Pyrinomonadaceae bacterium]